MVYFQTGKGRFGASVIRRTASLDTLYHKGQWSRDYYLHAGQLQVDKSTQVCMPNLYTNIEIQALKKQALSQL